MFIISHWPTKFSTRGLPASLTRLDALGAPALQSVPAGPANGCCGLTPAPLGLLCAPHRPAHPCRWETFRTKIFLFWISQCFWKGKTWTFRQSRKRTADLGFEPPILPLCSCVTLGEPVALHFLTTERETKHGATTWGHRGKEVCVQCWGTWLSVKHYSHWSSFPHHWKALKPVGLKCAPLKCCFRRTSEFSDLGNAEVPSAVEALSRLHSEGSALCARVLCHQRDTRAVILVWKFSFYPLSEMKWEVQEMTKAR